MTAPKAGEERCGKCGEPKQHRFHIPHIPNGNIGADGVRHHFIPAPPAVEAGEQVTTYARWTIHVDADDLCRVDRGHCESCFREKVHGHKTERVEVVPASALAACEEKLRKAEEELSNARMNGVPGCFHHPYHRMSGLDVSECMNDRLAASEAKLAQAWELVTLRKWCADHRNLFDRVADAEARLAEARGLLKMAYNDWFYAPGSKSPYPLMGKIESLLSRLASPATTGKE